MFSRDVPELVELELLEAVARHGSMSAAAAELGLSQQAVSLRIRAIEQRLRQPVLVRTRRGSQLTPAGRLLNEWAAPLLDDARQLAAGLASLRTDRAAHLRVASSLTVAEHLLPGWLVALHEQQARAERPATDVVLSAVNSDTVVARVRSGEADLGFIEGPHHPPALHTRTVAVDQLVVVVAPAHPWARRRTPVTPALLARTPMIRRESGSGSRQAFDDALAAALPPGTPFAPPALDVSTPAAARAAAGAGVGPTAISARAVADDLTLGRLVAVPVTGLELSRPLRAVWARDARPPAGPARDLLALAAAGLTGRGR